ncbi:hypothetical protein [Saccharothrix sp.]|uniref:hypothetical protein n=1 Tax=Saccharothrix sp. TaxID=1873460 RepID=UPI0028117491|nr:hypothetical protein [Saccharothrix sp.]
MSHYIHPITPFDESVSRPRWSAEAHRDEARRLLTLAEHDDTANRLAAAHVHAVLALSLRPLPGSA